MTNTPDRKKSNRLAGHELPNEGRIRGVGGWLTNGPGRARCSCGERSPELPTTHRRKQWHRDHKDDVRAQQSAAADGARLAAQDDMEVS